MRIIPVKQTESPEWEIYSGLSEPQLLHYYEPEPGLFIAESPMIIRRALDAGYEPVSFLAEEGFLQAAMENLQAGAPHEPDGIRKEESGREVASEILRDMADRDIPIYAAPLELLKTITGFMLTRGLLCAMRRRPPADVGAILGQARRIAVLENVMNPTNTGAIFRSAAALGMDAVLLSPGCTDPLYRRAARVSMGTVFKIPWTYLSSWPEDIRLLRDYGYHTISMSPDPQAVPLQELKLRPDEKAALILGTEGPGLMPQTVAACGSCVMIPMARGVDSLNVAAASAVAFWHIRP